MAKNQKEDGFRIKLTLLERLMVMSSLPQQEDVTTLRLVRVLREKLSLTEQEHGAHYEVDTRAFVRLNEARERAYTFTAFEVAQLVSALRKLNTEKRLTEQHLSLWDKFIDSPQVSE